jgi:DNA-binding CsgD family transcriptional regulator
MRTNSLLKFKSQIEDFTKLGYSDKTIANILNTSVYKVSNFRRNNKILHGRYYKKENILKLHNQGRTFSEISKILNISDSSISYIAKNMNLKPNWTKRSYYTKLDKIKGYMIRNVKFSAKRRNLEFDLDYTDIILPKVCPLLNIPLNYNSNFQDISYPTIDRIDNNKGYIKGNIWVISRLANSMKNSANFEQLNNFCINMQTLLKNWGALGNITDIFQIEEISEK